MLPVEVVVGVTDTDGDKSTFSLYQHPNYQATSTRVSEQDASGAVRELLPTIDSLTQGRIAGAEICIDVDISGITGNTMSDSADVEEKAELKYRTSSGRTSVINLPAYNAGTLDLPGTDTLDTASTAIAPLLVALEDGITVTGGSVLIPCDVGEDDLSELVTARGVTKNSGSRS